MKLCHNFLIDGEGNCGDSCGSTVVPRPRSAKLRRLGRTSAESGAVPPTIQHTPIDRALADLMLKTITIAKSALYQRERWLKYTYSVKVLGKVGVEVKQMSKKKKDASKAVLGSSQVEGQGTTNQELSGGVKAPSSRNRKKK